MVLRTFATTLIALALFASSSFAAIDTNTDLAQLPVGSELALRFDVLFNPAAGNRVNLKQEMLNTQVPARGSYEILQNCMLKFDQQTTGTMTLRKDVKVKVDSITTKVENIGWFGDAWAKIYTVQMHSLAQNLPLVLTCQIGFETKAEVYAANLKLPLGSLLHFYEISLAESGDIN